ncbi:MAG: maleylacetoacetate isomerase [Burkholderiaceae bacterium]
MQLYTYFRSSAAYRVRIALNIKQLAWTPEVVWLPDNAQAGPDYKAVNPHGLVPTLVDNGHELGQSLAILEYLDETHPKPALLPADPLARAQVRALALLVACDIHPVNNLRILNYLKSSMGHNQEQVNEWYRHWCHEGLAGYEADLARRPAGRFSFGDSVTMADCCLVPQVFNAQRFDVDISAYPNIARINDTCLKMPEFAKAQPSEQPEAT